MALIIVQIDERDANDFKTFEHKCALKRGLPFPITGRGFCDEVECRFSREICGYYEKLIKHLGLWEED